MKKGKYKRMKGILTFQEIYGRSDRSEEITESIWKTMCILSLGGYLQLLAKTRKKREAWLYSQGRCNGKTEQDIFLSGEHFLQNARI